MSNYSYCQSLSMSIIRYVPPKKKWCGIKKHLWTKQIGFKLALFLNDLNVIAPVYHLDHMAEKEIGKNASVVIGIFFEECLGH